MPCNVSQMTWDFHCRHDVSILAPEQKGRNVPILAPILLLVGGFIEGAPMHRHFRGLNKISPWSRIIQAVPAYLHNIYNQTAVRIRFMSIFFRGHTSPACLYRFDLYDSSQSACRFHVWKHILVQISNVVQYVSDTELHLNQRHWATLCCQQRICELHWMVRPIVIQNS